MYNIAVIGAGIIGVSTAVNIQRAIPNSKVRIIADKLDQETTSWGAGGLFRPTDTYIQGVSKDKIRKWSTEAWSLYSKLAVSDKAGETGMQIIPGYILSQKKIVITEKIMKGSDEFGGVHFQISKGDITLITNPLYKEFVFSFNEMSTEQLKNLGFDKYKYGYEVTTIITIVRHYLPWLTKQFIQNGGEIIQRKVETLEEFVGQYDLVVNCTALGSRSLVGDETVYPVRGQIVRVRAPWIKYWVYTEDDAYIIPNGELLAVGGCRQVNNYDTRITMDDTEGILSRCYSICPALKGAEIDHVWTGLRPTRSPIRIEKETMDFPKGKLKVVHNYGHGANGISMSWGTSLEATELVKESLQLHSKL